MIKIVLADSVSEIDIVLYVAVLLLHLGLNTNMSLQQMQTRFWAVLKSVKLHRRVKGFLWDLWNL